jgi:hypothetical protein
MIWTIIEPGLGITAASIVALRPLLRALKIRGFTSDNDAGPYHHSNSRATGPYVRSGRNSGRGFPRDSEALGTTHALDSTSHKMNSLCAFSGAMVNTTVSTGKKGASASMRTYEGSRNESQEIILAPVDSRG